MIAIDETRGVVVPRRRQTPTDPICAVDIGSKNVKLVIGENHDGHIRTRLLTKQTLQLGADVRENEGRIGSQKLADLRDVLSQFAEMGTAMGAAKTSAVLLPGAFVTLGETQKPPVDAMREHGVPIAIATDCNPGTSPICSLRTAMMLAARVFRLTPEECLAGVTREAARALRLDDRGTLQTGKRADIAVWDVDHPRELAYWFGTPQLAEVMVDGHTTAP